MSQSYRRGFWQTVPRIVALCMVASAALGLYIACYAAPTGRFGGNVYHVNGQRGDDGNPGSAERPWRTIGKANDTLNAGDMVIIHAGSYDEVIEPKNSGKPGRKITYTAQPGDEVTIRGRPGRTTIVALRRSYIVVEGFVLTYGHGLVERKAHAGWIFLNGEGANHIEIRNCRIVREGDPEEYYRQGNFDIAIKLSAATNNLIENNYIRGLNQGINLNEGSRFNRILNNRITETSQSSIVIGSSKGIIQGNLIEGNVLETSAIEDGIQFHPNYQAVDMASDASNRGTIIRNNVIRRNNENAIDLKGASNVVIEGNIIYGTVGSNDGGIDGWNRNSMGSIIRGKNTTTRDVIIRKNILYDNANGVWVFEGFKVYNNTVLYNNRDYEGSQSNWRSSADPFFFGIAERIYGTSGLSIKNNIVGGHRNAGEVVLRMGPLSDVDIDYNLYFSAEQVHNVDYRTSGDWQGLPFEEWRRVLAAQRYPYGNDAHSLVVADPRLVYGSSIPTGDLLPSDFSLQADSPAIDKGGPLTVAAAGGSGTQLAVQDAGYFFDGYEIVAGDWIVVGDQPAARIVAIDYAKNVITLDRAITWQAGDWVTLPYSGTAPDIGAEELGGEPTAPNLAFSVYLPLLVGPEND